MASDDGPGLRVDLWLYHARFFKSRTLAGKMVSRSKLRIDGTLTSKAHFDVRPGNVLTFKLGDVIKVVKIIALSTRRGPAPEAQALYEDLTPPPPKKSDAPDRPAAVGAREPGSGRPTKADRRALNKFRDNY